MNEFRRVPIDQIQGGPSLEEVPVGQHQRKYRRATELFDASRRKIGELSEQIVSATREVSPNIRELRQRRAYEWRQVKLLLGMRGEILTNAKEAGEPVRSERDDSLEIEKSTTVVEFPLPKYVSLN